MGDIAKSSASNPDIVIAGHLNCLEIVENPHIDGEYKQFSTIGPMGSTAYRLSRIITNLTAVPFTGTLHLLGSALAGLVRVRKESA